MKPDVASLMAFAFLVGCGGSSNTGTTPTTVTTVQAVSGDGQSVSVAEAALAPLVVKVLEDGAPKSGATVGFSSRRAASFSTVPNTDASGLTQAIVTAGTVAGSDTITVSSGGATTSDTFFLTIRPGAPDTLRKLAGDGQRAAPGTTLGYPLVIDVKDKYFNNIEGVSVGWTTTGGSLSAATTTTATGGITQVTLTLPNTPGIARVTAQISGIGSVTFQAEAR
jgi:adhesin/invasin